MRVTVRATLAGTVGSLEKKKPYLQLVDLSQDVDAVKEYFGNRPAVEQFDGFLVDVQNGEYGEVYGFDGNIAYTGKNVWKITRTYSESKPRYSAGKAKKKSKKSSNPGLRAIR